MDKPYLVIELEQQSPEWHEYRKGKLGASEIPAVLDISPYTSRKQLLHEKITGEQKQFSEFSKMKMAEGHVYEEKARMAFIEATNQTFKPVVLQSKFNAKFFCSLDGFNDQENHVLEIKTTQVDNYIMLAKDGLVTDFWNAQIQYQLFISGCDQATLIVVDSRNGDMHIVGVNRNQAFIEKIQVEAEAFLRDMETQVSPFMQLENAEMQELAAHQNFFSELENELSEIKEKIKTKATELLKKHGATKIEGYGILIQMCEGKLTTDYSEIPQLKGVDLSKYKKKGKPYVMISKSKKGKETNK